MLHFCVASFYELLCEKMLLNIVFSARVNQSITELCLSGLLRSWLQDRRLCDTGITKEP